MKKKKKNQFVMFEYSRVNINTSNNDLLDCSVIRASVPKLDLDDVFEQKNEIAKAVEEELEKVFTCQTSQTISTSQSVVNF